MKSIRLWSPDTCGCIIHLSGEETPDGWVQDIEPYVTREEAESIHIKYRAAVSHANPDDQPPSRVCPAHAHLGPTTECYNVVLKENRAKNII